MTSPFQASASTPAQRTERDRLRRAERARLSLARGECAVCHRRPLVPDGTRCADCERKWASRNSAAAPGDKPKQSAEAAARVAGGACSTCTRRPAVGGLRTCAECRERHKQNRRQEGGLSWYTRKTPPVDVTGLLLVPDTRADRKRLPLIERRRWDCAALSACEEAWIERHRGGRIGEQARCPPSCPAFEAMGPRAAVAS